MIEGALKGQHFELKQSDEILRIINQGNQKTHFGFQVENLDFVSHRNTLEVKSALLKLDLNVFCDKFIQLFHKQFREKFNSVFSIDSQNRVWIWSEFQKPGNKYRHRGYGDNLYGSNLPVGITGICLRLVAIPFQGVAFILDDFFSIGYTPSHIFERLRRALEKCFPRCGEEAKRDKSSNLLIYFINIAYILSKLPVVAKLAKSCPSIMKIPESVFENDWKMAQNGFYHLKFDKDNNPVSFSEIPLHIYEAIKNEKLLAKIDNLILKDRATEAVEQLLHTDNLPSELFANRLAILMNLCLAAQNKEMLEKIKPYQATQLACNSAAIKACFTMNDNQEAIKLLSNLYLNLEKQQVLIESISILDVALCELMGDAWSKINLNKAILSYERILQRKSAHPRVLRKLTTLYRDLGDLRSEARMLDALIENEPRKREQAKLLNDKYNLMRNPEFQNAELESASLIELAYSIDPNNPEIFKNYLLYLANSKRFIMAQQLVDTQLQNSNFSNVFLSELLVICAKIWMDAYDRVDLAEDRISQALDYNYDNAEAIHLLRESILKNPEKAGSILAKNVLHNSLTQDPSNSSIKVLELILDKGNFDENDLVALTKLLDQSLYQSRAYPKLLIKLYENYQDMDYWKKCGPEVIKLYIKYQTLQNNSELKSILAELAKNCIKNFDAESRLPLISEMFLKKIANVVDLVEVSAISGDLDSFLSFIVPDYISNLSEKELCFLLEKSSGFNAQFKYYLLNMLTSHNSNWNQDLKDIVYKNYTMLTPESIVSAVNAFDESFLEGFEGPFWSYLSKNISLFDFEDFKQKLDLFLQNTVDFNLHLIGMAKLKNIFILVKNLGNVELFRKLTALCVEKNIPLPLTVAEVEGVFSRDPDKLFEYYLHSAKSLDLESRKQLLLKAVKIETSNPELESIRFDLCLKSFKNKMLVVTPLEFFNLSKNLNREEFFFHEVEQFLLKKGQTRSLTLRDQNQMLSFALITVQYDDKR